MISRLGIICVAQRTWRTHAQAQNRSGRRADVARDLETVVVHVGLAVFVALNAVVFAVWVITS